jgi:hypothetical protein
MKARLENAALAWSNRIVFGPEIHARTLPRRLCQFDDGRCAGLPIVTEQL